ncbi:DLW-39 family protein [Intrasporangium sp. DVR]|uniref:DLW-39 family protein n=1 Tax=Intrasporangium sp. DVR TaxID=3127867 RepID=UPI00313A7410
MFKRLALIAGAIAGVAFFRKKARQQQAEQDLWNQATDDVKAQTPAPAPSPAADQDTPAATS